MYEWKLNESGDELEKRGWCDHNLDSIKWISDAYAETIVCLKPCLELPQYQDLWSTKDNNINILGVRGLKVEKYPEYSCRPFKCSVNLLSGLIFQ